MTSDLLASIVIPAYNAERFIGETLESALSQKGVAAEILVIDDGSTDRTLETVRRFGTRVRAETGPNRGASAARNRGTSMARGAFLQYLDADDLLEPHAIAGRIDALRSQRADVAYSDWEELCEQADGGFLPGRRVDRSMEEVDPDPEIATFTAFWSPPAALLYTREIVDRIGPWREDLPIIQDARFLQDAAMRGAKFARVAGVGARYRVHRTHSLSRGKSGAFAADVFHNACDVQEIWASRGALTRAQRIALAAAYDFVCRATFAGDPAAFAASHARFLAVSPTLRPLWPRLAGALAKALGYRAARRVLGALGKLPGAGA